VDKILVKLQVKILLIARKGIWI